MMDTGNINICDLIYESTLVVYNNFEQMLIFNHSIFSHFVQNVNDIWYAGRQVNVPPRYQI